MSNPVNERETLVNMAKLKYTEKIQCGPSPSTMASTMEVLEGLLGPAMGDFMTLDLVARVRTLLDLPDLQQEVARDGGKSAAKADTLRELGNAEFQAGRLWSAVTNFTNSLVVAPTDGEGRGRGAALALANR